MTGKGNETLWRRVTLAVLLLAVIFAAFYSTTIRRERQGSLKKEDVMMKPLLPDICSNMSYEGNVYIVCGIDLARYDIELFHTDSHGEPYGSVNRFIEVSRTDGHGPILAMNAGMYHQDLSPVGLYVEKGREMTQLNLEDDKGNFFLKPNGVFFISRQGRAGIMESEAFLESGFEVELATQSGPMLVMDGEVHPRFLPDGTSRYIRNGVGVTPDGEAILAISRSPVSLGAFARAFRDRFGCPDALFLDGGISAFAAEGRAIIGGNDAAGPILTVSSKAPNPVQ